MDFYQKRTGRLQNISSDMAQDKKPTLLNSHNTNVSLETCKLQCNMNKNCDYITFAKVEADPSKKCNSRFNTHNYNNYYQIGGPYIPKTQHFCYQYQLKDGCCDSQIRLKENNAFDTYAKKSTPLANSAKLLN